MQCFTEDETRWMKGPNIQVGLPFRPRNHGWEDLYNDDKWLVPDGAVVIMEVLDDTLPGGPRQVTRSFKAPFARASREDDYRTAWAFFENANGERANF